MEPNQLVQIRAENAKPTALAAGAPETSDDDPPVLTLLFEALCASL